MFCNSRCWAFCRVRTSSLRFARISRYDSASFANRHFSQTPNASAMAAKVTLNVGDTAPDFTLKDQDGNDVTLSKCLASDKYVVVYFYPRDFTPGCTAEACNFRDNYSQFQVESATDPSAVVLGISPDSVESHLKFKQKHNLPFTLLSDPKSEVFQLFGVQPALFGLSPGRKTFVVNKQSKVTHIYDSLFFAKTHVSEALKAVKTLREQELKEKQQPQQQQPEQQQKQ